MKRIIGALLVIPLSGVLLGACHSTTSTVNPQARASASRAVQDIKNNKNAQADLSAANTCAVKALSSTLHPVSTFETCMRASFPKGGSRAIATCVGQQLVLNDLKGKAAVEAAVAAKCESLR